MPKIGKHLEHTKDEISKYLKVFKELVSKKQFVVSQNNNRLENREFIKRYHLKEKKQMQMLLDIDVLDFCYSVDDYKNPNERLYIFLKEYELDYWGILEKVSVYIKIAIKKGDFTVIISFHEANKLTKKLFI